MTHLTQKVLAGYSNLPHFLVTDISACLATDKSMELTDKALKGFSLLVNPPVNFEHTGRQLDLSLLSRTQGTVILWNKTNVDEGFPDYCPVLSITSLVFVILVP